MSDYIAEAGISSNFTDEYLSEAGQADLLSLLAVLVTRKVQGNAD